MIRIIVLLLLLTGCAHDWRTDRERNEGVILSEDQIQVRREIRNIGYRERNAYEDEQRFRRGLRLCGSSAGANMHILDCLRESL